eukprot:m.23772 g.23772  ORF g.23772 m.23772 type:complete len:77 (-) comp11427_c0_seq2:396-626(-)
MSLLQRASCTIAPRVPHLVALRHAGQNVRLGRGQSKNGTTYGALTDGPDWTHLGSVLCRGVSQCLFHSSLLPLQLL